jgi:hypothetical protein
MISMWFNSEVLHCISDMGKKFTIFIRSLKKKIHKKHRERCEDNINIVFGELKCVRT